MKNKFKQKRIVFVASVAAISVLALIFIIINFRSNIVFFYSPSELKNEEIVRKINGRKIRVGGLVKENSMEKTDASNFEFLITDLENDLKIYYNGILPDLFRQGQGVVASGEFNVEKNEFYSKELLIKHDEKYMPPEVAKSLKKK